MHFWKKMPSAQRAIIKTQNWRRIQTAEDVTENSKNRAKVIVGWLPCMSLTLVLSLATHMLPWAHHKWSEFFFLSQIPRVWLVLEGEDLPRMLWRCQIRPKKHPRHTKLETFEAPNLQFSVNQEDVHCKGLWQLCCCCRDTREWLGHRNSAWCSQPPMLHSVFRGPSLGSKPVSNV